MKEKGSKMEGVGLGRFDFTSCVRSDAAFRCNFHLRKS